MNKDIEKWDNRHPSENESVQATDSSPAMMMQVALNQGLDVEKLEKMLELQQKWEEKNAERCFFEALAAFQENPPEVLKDKENSQFTKGNKKAMYVSLGNLLKTVNPALGKHGLSTSFEINQAEKSVTVSCKLSHKSGHSEKVTMIAPPDDSGGNAKNPIQKIKSTITYLRAATFEAVTGLAATDEANVDDDGNSSSEQPEYVTEKQLSNITDMANSKNIPAKEILEKFKLEELSKTPKADYFKIIGILTESKARD